MPPGAAEGGGFAAVLLLGLITVQVTLTAAVLLRPRRRQSSSLAWILVILLLPGLGIFLWALLGEVRLGAARRARHAQLQVRARDRLAPIWERRQAPHLPEHQEALARLGLAVCGAAPRAGTRVRLLPDSEQFVQELVAAIDAARESVCILTYIWGEDQSGRAVAEAVARAARRGVACHALADALGARAMLGGPLQRLMEEAGAEVRAALKPPFPPLLTGRIDLRNHRKLAILDHRVAFVGSQNLTDADFAPSARAEPWVDCSLRLEGPAAADLEQLFAEDWELDGGASLLEGIAPSAPHEDGVPVQVMGTGPNSENDALVQIIQALVHTAHEEVILTTPYFVPDEGTLAALTTAARRGVRVEVIVPQRSDSRLVRAASRSTYEVLLEAGAELHEFTGGMLHAKTLTVDRTLAFIGSANMDRRSFEINFEVSTLVYDSDVASHLRLLQLTYRDRSRRIDPRLWSRRGPLRRIAHNAAGLLSPLL
jgi:cardiolipin synthase